MTALIESATANKPIIGLDEIRIRDALPGRFPGRQTLPADLLGRAGGVRGHGPRCPYEVEIRDVKPQAVA